MKRELALRLAQTESPEQMADRIVELYETIEELDSTLRAITAEGVKFHKPGEFKARVREILFPIAASLSEAKAAEEE